MATTQEKWQEIANRGLQNRFDPATKAKFDEAVRRGLITLPSAKQSQEIQDDSVRSVADNGINNANTGIEKESLIKDVDNALLKIPGVPSLAEFAAGANRSVAGFLDFLGPNNINAILELSGSERRVPTFSGAMASEGGFVEPGLQRESLATAGELVPAAVGIGQALRSLAGRLPAVAGESTGAGVVRQLGASKPMQDVTGAAAAGVGQEVGREFGGEGGAMIGSVAAPLALAIPLQSATRQAKTLLKKSAPSVDKLKETASQIYRSLDESGVSVPSQSFNTLADDIASTLRKEGADVDLTPKAMGLINRLNTEKGTPKTLTELDTLRKVARSAAESMDRSEARLGNIAISKIDDYLDNIGGEITQGKQAGEAFKSARDLWQRARKTELLETAIKNADNQATGFENGIRTQFRQILKRIDSGKLKGFTNEEKEAIKKVVKGTNAGNVARFLGKFGVLDGVTSRSLTTLGGAGLAGAAGGPGAAAAVPIVGQISGALSERMTLNNAKMAQDIIKAGKNSAAILSAYVRNTPKAQQSAAEVAQLLLRNKVPVSNINLNKAPELLSSGAILAAIAKINDSKEESDQK